MNEKRRQLLDPERVMAAVEQTASVAEAAELLGVHRVSLYRYMREQGIRIEYDRRVAKTA